MIRGRLVRLLGGGTAAPESQIAEAAGSTVTREEDEGWRRLGQSDHRDLSPMTQEGCKDARFKRGSGTCSPGKSWSSRSPSCWPRGCG